MIVLTATTDSLEVILGGAITTNQLRVITSARDLTTTAYLPNRNVLNTNNTTAITAVAAPGAAHQIVCDYISVFNSDTVAATVTVRYNLNGSFFEIFKAVLGAGEKLEYVDGQGFKVFSSTGAIKTSINQGNNAVSSSLSSTVLGSDVINNNGTANTIADVTGLSFPVVTGNTYWFRFIIKYTSAATTTGSRWSINGPSITELMYCSEYSLTTITQTTNDGLSAYDTPAASNISSAATGSNIAIIEGFIKPAADGTIIARFASEVLSSAITAKAGSVVYYQQVS